MTRACPWTSREDALLARRTARHREGESRAASQALPAQAPSRIPASGREFNSIHVVLIITASRQRNYQELLKRQQEVSLEAQQNYSSVLSLRLQLKLCGVGQMPQTKQKPASDMDQRKEAGARPLSRGHAIQTPHPTHSGDPIKASLVPG